MKNILKKRGGFTLIELLVVIAIIGLLTGIVVANLTASRAKARDAKRISDMGQIQLALELYFDRCNEYPPTSSGGDSIDENFPCTSNGTDIYMTTFISKIPTPPVHPDNNWNTNYKYYVNSDQTDYVLQTSLEGNSEVLKDSMTGPINFGAGNVTSCDTGSPDFHYCRGPR